MKVAAANAHLVLYKIFRRPQKGSIEGLLHVFKQIPSKSPNEVPRKTSWRDILPMFLYNPGQDRRALHKIYG